MLRVGELARRTGLTVRTLHHYDRLGLLRPSVRSEAGYRLYDRDDLARLHRIQLLKQLDYSLADIRELLDDPPGSPVEAISRQLEVLDARIRQYQRLHGRLEQLRQKLALQPGDVTDDWLTLLELMTMLEKHLSEDELAALDAGEQARGRPWLRDGAELVSRIQDAIDRGVPKDSEEAAELAWSWVRFMKEATGNDPRLLVKLSAMQQAEPRAQELNGITPALTEWVGEAFAHARVTLFAPYLTPLEQDEVRRRHLAHIHDWPPLVAEVRDLMEQQADPASPPVQELAGRWIKLFQASYCGDNAALEGKIHTAFHREPRLMSGIGVDVPLITFIQQAMLALNRPSQLPSATGEAAPKPSAHRVAILRAAHQLLDDPLVLEDPLALTILGPEDETALRQHLDRYRDPFSVALRTTLVVRARVAEDAWAAAERDGVRQYVVLGAGLDTFAYRGKTAPDTRLFEVDLPATQQWKRDCLKQAGIAEPPSLRYVPVDFETATLADSLARAGFRADQPAFFAWLGVVVYLEEAAVFDTLRFIASCAPGSGVVFDYCVETDLLNPLEQVGMKMAMQTVAAHGEPWKSQFHPNRLAATMRAMGFSAAESLAPDVLNQRYLADRQDGLRMGGVTRLMHGQV